MILDIILIAIAAVLVIIGIRRGIARTLLNLLSVAVSGVLAYFVSKIAANWVYSSYISQTVTKSVTDTVSGSARNAEIISQEAIDQLPEFIKALLRAFGIQPDSFAGSAAKAATESSGAIAQTVDNTIAPVVTAVLSVLSFVLLFVILLIVCKFISRKLVHVFELPVINSLNRLLGGVLGLLEGAAICYIGILVCRIILPLSAQPIITPEMIDASVVFKAMYYSDFINAVALVFGSGAQPADSLVEQATEAVTNG